MGTLGRILVLWGSLLGVLPAAAAKLDGQWLLEFQTEDGLGKAALSLEREESALNVGLRIDRHRLVGKAALTGNKFEVDLRHAEQPGSPAHSSRLYLRGHLVGDHLRGTWDDGEHQGEWVGTRYLPKGLGDIYEARADHGLSGGRDHLHSPPRRNRCPVLSGKELMLGY